MLLPLAQGQENLSKLHPAPRQPEQRGLTVVVEGDVALAVALAICHHPLALAGRLVVCLVCCVEETGARTLVSQADAASVLLQQQVGLWGEAPPVSLGNTRAALIETGWGRHLIACYTLHSPEREGEKGQQRQL